MIIFAADGQPDALVSLINSIRKMKPDADIHGFHSGQDLLDYAKDHVCDVAFLDLDMPGLSGLETARLLMENYPRVNIIFTGEDGRYAMEALALRVSGYIIKPVTQGHIREELDNLRYPVGLAHRRVHFQCFGNFEVFIDGAPVDFRYSKSKEILAYVIDKRSVCTKEQIGAALWENSVSSSYLRTLRKDIIDVFTSKGCEEAIIHGWGKLGINRDKVSCDFYDWMRGLPEAVDAYWGEYMAQYSWAEVTNAMLERKHAERYK